jgi:hypothetical protein
MSKKTIEDKQTGLSDRVNALAANMVTGDVRKRGRAVAGVDYSLLGVTRTGPNTYTLSDNNEDAAEAGEKLSKRFPAVRAETTLQEAFALLDAWRANHGLPSL